MDIWPPSRTDATEPSQIVFYSYDAFTALRPPKCGIATTIFEHCPKTDTCGFKPADSGIGKPRNGFPVYGRSLLKRLIPTETT